jgi:hypothetical protein
LEKENKEEENRELRQKLDGRIERWVSVEYNAPPFGRTAENSFSLDAGRYRP